MKSHHADSLWCLLKISNIIIATLVITSTTVTAQTLTMNIIINATSIITDTTSVLVITSSSATNNIIVLPTTTMTFRSRDMNSGFVPQQTSAYIVPVTDTLNTAVLVVTMVILSTSTESGTPVPTIDNVTAKTNSISSSTIVIITSITLGTVAFTLCLVIYFVSVRYICKKRRTKSYRVSQVSKTGHVGMTTIANDALFYYNKHHNYNNNEKESCDNQHQYDGKSNAYAIVSLQEHDNVDKQIPEPYLEPNPIAMEYETPIDRIYENLKAEQ